MRVTAATPISEWPMPIFPPPSNGRRPTKPQLGLVALAMVIAIGLAVLTWWMARAPVAQ
jgi:hypothetical protein